jgi:hypothetical protein
MDSGAPPITNPQNLLFHQCLGGVEFFVECPNQSFGLSTSKMAESVYSNYPPDLSPAQQKFLVTYVKDWAIQSGLAVRPSSAIIPNGADTNGVLATNAPVTLFPSPFPRTCFEEAAALQGIYNELYANITCDEKWLGRIVEG